MNSTERDSKVKVDANFILLAEMIAKDENVASSFCCRFAARKRGIKGFCLPFRGSSEVTTTSRREFERKNITRDTLLAW